MEFSVTNVGQFGKASVKFGDLTLFVGAQGTGKSIFLQLFKLYRDRGYVETTMSDFGQDWNKQSQPSLFEAYFGEGMQFLWRDDSRVRSRAEKAPANAKPRINKNAKQETVFYIPAQRVLTMQTGWPQPYRSYSPRDPFVVKNFSERIRLYLESLKEKETLFPISKKLKASIRDILDATVFHGASVSRSTKMTQKELRLNVGGDGDKAIPYMAWSTGQREFLPLLLGCYELLPAGRATKRGEVESVVIEEPEMGLHPMGTVAAMVLIIDLLSRGYRVMVTTHSSDVLDAVWAITTIQRQGISGDAKVESIAAMLGLPTDVIGVSEMIRRTLTLDFRTYNFYYEKGRVNSKDISTLDPWDEDEAVSGWGGLSSFNSLASEIVAKAVGRQA